MRYHPVVLVGTGNVNASYIIRAIRQTRRRPALVLSPASYNRRSGLAIMCPITSRIKGYPFEVELPQGLDVSGAVLADHVKSLDWRIRCAEPAGKVPAAILRDVLARLAPLLGL